MNEPVQVAIVGGGITGLTLAHGLIRRGVSVRLLEASEQVGGVIQTLRQDGFLLEQGPFSVLVRSNAFRELLDELSLEPVEVDAGSSKKRFVLRDGALRAAPTSPAALLTTRLLSVRGRLRLLRGIVRSPARGEDVDETMAEVAARRLGQESADFLASPIAVGVFGAEASELSFDACVPMYAKADREAGSIIGMMKSAKRAREAAGGAAARRSMISFEGGLAALTGRLGSACSAAVGLGRRVTSIERAGSRFVVSAGTEQVSADAVALAASPHATAELIEPLAPAASSELRDIRSCGLGVVHLGFRRENVQHPLDGFGFLLPRSERLAPMLGAIWASSVFPHHAPSGHVLIRVIIGGTRWPEAVEKPDDVLVEQSLAALRPLLGLRGDPTLAQVRCWAKAVPVYAPGHAERTGRIDEAVKGAGNLWCAGNWKDGLGVNDRVVAGRRMAAAISAQLSGAQEAVPVEQVA